MSVLFFWLFIMLDRLNVVILNLTPEQRSIFFPLKGALSRMHGPIFRNIQENEEPRVCLVGQEIGEYRATKIVDDSQVVYVCVDLDNGKDAIDDAFKIAREEKNKQKWVFFLCTTKDKDLLKESIAHKWQPFIVGPNIICDGVIVIDEKNPSLAKHIGERFETHTSTFFKSVPLLGLSLGMAYDHLYQQMVVSKASEPITVIKHKDTEKPISWLERVSNFFVKNVSEDVSKLPAHDMTENPDVFEVKAEFATQYMQGLCINFSKDKNILPAPEAFGHEFLGTIKHQYVDCQAAVHFKLYKWDFNKKCPDQNTIDKMIKEKDFFVVCIDLDSAEFELELEDFNNAFLQKIAKENLFFVAKAHEKNRSLIKENWGKINALGAGAILIKDAQVLLTAGCCQSLESNGFIQHKERSVLISPVLHAVYYQKIPYVTAHLIEDEVAHVRRK